MQDKDSIELEIQELVAEMKSFHIATISREGWPEASYSPFLYQAPEFFIFVSALASHTNNLLSNDRCSVMLIEDEARAASIHQRKRLMLNCRAVLMKQEEKEAQPVLDDMATHLGNTVSIIRQLPDFKLFRLRVAEGRYVKGFGAAYQINGDLVPVELIKGR